MTARFVSEQPGITSWHSFSAGAHYDPDNVAFGPVIGCDEHLVSPGAGFDWHGHRDVHIVSRVLEGALRHEDSAGETYVVGPGEFLAQSTGDGIRHIETNASDVASLRFLQLTLLGSRGMPRLLRTDDAVHVDGHRIAVARSVPRQVPAYVLVIDTGEDLRLRRPMDDIGPPNDLLVVELAAQAGTC